MEAQPLLVIILGPTASGKTALAVSLARALETEIVSADSRQVYREMSIGTAVPSLQEQGGIPHHLLGHHSIHDNYSAYRFELEALEALEQLFRSHNPVIMAGGSGLYINAVCHGIDDIPTVDREVRESLVQKYRSEGLESLRAMLRKVDPEYYARVDLRNPKRILKALEISMMTGKPYSSFLTNTRKQRFFRTLKVGLMPERKALYRNINNRVDRMIREGLPGEARELYPYRSLNALNTVGYRELFAWMDGKLTLDEAIEKIKANTRKYARKQITWFRKDPEIRWFQPGEFDEVLSYIRASMEPTNQQNPES